MKTKPFLVSVYSEDIALGELIHNKLDQSEYQVAFSCSSVVKLLHCLEGNPCLLVFGCNGYTEEVKQSIARIRKKYPKMKILLRIAGSLKKKPDTSLLEDKMCSVLGNSSFRDILNELEKMLPDHPAHQKITNDPVNLLTHFFLSGNPFIDVVKDQDKFTVIKLSSKGMSAKEIVSFTGMELNRVETLKKQIIHETGSKNITEAVSKAKDYHIL